MKINYYYLFSVVLALVFFTAESHAQTLHPSKIKKAAFFDKSKKLVDMKPVPPGVREKNMEEEENKEIPNRFDIPIEEITSPDWNGVDPALQDYTAGSRSEPVISQNFNGISNLGGWTPPDTQGDVGLNNYLQMVNTSFAIWDKEGNLLYGPVDIITLWDGFPGPWSNTNDGDPIVVYDEYAGRWIATQFSGTSKPNGPWYQLVAVSATEDPLGEWYRYAFQTDKFGDYPKFGVWPDGYFFTVNQFTSPGGGSWAGAGIGVIDRESVINGDPDAEMIFFNMGTSYASLLPADADGAMAPPENASCRFMGLGTNGSSVRFWKSTIDWNNTANSSISFEKTISVDAFSNQGISVRQPGTSQLLDIVQGRLMYRLQYRNFGDYEVMVANHTVNAGSGRAGVRWYEFRNYGDGWDIYQQGTFAPSDGDGRWMGSVAMNHYGDIIVAYSVSSTSTYPSIRFTGQSKANSGTGILDIPETSIQVGTASQTGSERWGDYSMASIDPADGETFWYTTEYSSGGTNWKTKIASVNFVQEPEADFVVDEPLIPTGQTVNFTDLTTGLPNSWEWTFEGGTPSSSTDQNPEGIMYSTDGTYTVTLTASNELGNSTVEKVDYISVSSSLMPDVEFEANKQFVCTSDIVQLTDNTLYSPIQWLWEFSPSTVTFVNGTDETSQNPQVIFGEAVDYTVTLTAYNLNGPSSLTKTDYISAGGIIPYYIETFSDLDWLDRYWTIENVDNENTWEYFAVGGTGADSMAAGLDFSKYFAIGQRDRLISPAFNLSGFSTASLEFQYAYAQRLTEISDSLIVLISDDCGENWTRIYYNGEDGSGNFATHEPVPDGSFWPMVPSDWCISGWGATCVTLDISAWAGNPDVLIAFETWAGYGNPLFIDNVAISQTVGENEFSSNDQLTVYPNPGNKVFHVVLPASDVYSEVQVLNQLGQLVYKTEINTGTKQLEINTDNSWKSGVYYLKVIGSENTITKKILKY